MPNSTNSQVSKDIQIKLSTPGKVILHGEHSVVYGRVAIAASLGLRTKLHLQETTESPSSESTKETLTLHLKALNYKNVYDLAEIQSKLLNAATKYSAGDSSSFNYQNPDEINHEAVLKLVEEFVASKSSSQTGGLNQYQTLALTSAFYLLTGILCSVDMRPESLSLVIETQLNISAGTGSSASYLVSIAAAFVQYVRLKAQRLVLTGNVSKAAYKPAAVRQSSSGQQQQLDEADLEIVSKWAQNAERIIHGRVSGIDNTVCTYGSLVEFKKGVAPKMVKICEGGDFRLLLINSRVARNTKTLVAKVADLKETYPEIVEPLLDALNAVAVRAIELFASGGCSSGGDVESRQFYTKIEGLFALNHDILRALGVSHPSLEDICDRVRSHGLRAKLTGAGGGGYAIAIVPPFVDKKSLQELCQNLESAGYEAVLTELGGPGVVFET